MFLFITIYAVWILLIIIKQFDKKIIGLSKYDVFALIPNWTLFAPNPKYSDYKILYRDKFTDGTVSGLIEIDWICNKKTNFLWKGQMREQKLLSFISKDAQKYKKNNIDFLFFLNNKTMMLKNYVKHYNVPLNIVNRQLVVVETYGLVKKSDLIIFVTDIKYHGKY